MNPAPETLLKHPGLEKYRVSFHSGDILCSEGDESKDLYILLDGKLEVLKGHRKIAEVSDSGTFIGEISFLLETRRTATVRALSDGQAICIPKDQINQFLQEFPSLAWKIPRVLAERLDEGTQALHGLSEFCDQLPEAVIVAGPEGRIIAWNTPAEKLFGATWEHMHSRPAEEIFQDPAAYREFVKELQTTQAASEKIFRITHPDKGIRYVSTILKAIYDNHSMITGFLSLSRDVTETVILRQRYRRIRTWLFPAIACLMVLTGVLFFLYPKAQIRGIKQQAVTYQIAKDYLVLKSLLADPLYARDGKKVAQFIREFFRMQGKSPAPYLGILLLGKDKKVFGFYSPKADSSMSSVVGNTYEGITFQNIGGSIHNMLTVYHVTPGHPTGEKSIELAFELWRGEVFLGWVVFQMDMERLKQEFEMNEETLTLIQIPKTP